MINKPNILVFFCDQWRLDVLSCYGGNVVRTPNLDKLAARSFVFDHAHTPTAICSPARASLMTGLYPHGHHMFNNSTPSYSYCHHLRPDATMIQDWADAETHYETAYFGKWHIGPIKDLFESKFHHTPEGRSDLPEYTQTSSHWHPSPYMFDPEPPEGAGADGMVDAPMDQFPDVVAANLTCEFFEKRDSTRPFLAFCAFPGPHSPWLVPREFGIRYSPEEIPTWVNRHDSMEGKPYNQRKLRLMGKARKQAEDDDELKRLLTYQFSYMELIDQQVGKVLEALDKAGVGDDTLIVFTADHGDMAGSHGFLSKGSYMYDEIYRIPFIVTMPGQKEKKRTSALVNLMDLTATCAHAMTGEEQTVMGNNTLHGRSLLPFLEGEAAWDREVNFCEYHGDWYGHASSRMVTDGEWKLVLNFTDSCEFYNLKEDPAELNNRFHDPKVKEIRDHYFALLVEEAKRLKDGQVRGYSPEIEDALHG